MTLAVYHYHNVLIPILKDQVHGLSKIFYFSDGAAAQYKNKKNFSNLCHHEADFGIEAQWHLFATSHGKGACDGLGGTVKRLATRASIQRPNEGHISSAIDLFEFVKACIKNIQFIYVKKEDVEETGKKLQQRFLSEVEQQLRDQISIGDDIWPLGE